MAGPRLARARMALADETRVRLFDLLCDRPHSVKELAAALDVQPDRLYYHLRRLEAGGLVRVGSLRATPDGRAERVYEIDTTATRGPDVADPDGDHLVFLDAMLEATRVELRRVAAGRARAARSDTPEVTLHRGRLSLAPAELAELTERVAGLISEYAGRAEDGTRRPVQYLFTAYERAGARGR